MTSLSPAIHRMFADQLGLNISYQLIETGAEGFPQALESFRLSGGIGCNVTLPLKRDAWRLAAQASKEVSQAEAANTLKYQSESGWFANTTDGIGLVTDLSVNHGIPLEGQRILILGAGGATASVFGSLLAGNPKQVLLVNRNLDRARDLVERFGASKGISVSGWTDLFAHSGFDLVINATSLGHHGEAPGLSRSLFAPKAVCYDLNYYKASVPLKNLCEDMGQRYVDGLGMLVEQAAASFYIWTGKQPDSQAVIEAFR
ncbi:MAG: shikimate dehydrogenase [Gammaproteobacteria bacterium]|nr:shikimate dehydrogenase [Gammaproteobacteria bacterium]